MISAMSFRIFSRRGSFLWLIRRVTNKGTCLGSAGKKKRIKEIKKIEKVEMTEMTVINTVGHFRIGFGLFFKASPLRGLFLERPGNLSGPKSNS